MRMGMGRFTRLTNAFSKKVRNLERAVALHFMHYNFCRVHTTLKTTPAVAAGVADDVPGIGEIVALPGAKEANCPTTRMLCAGRQPAGKGRSGNEREVVSRILFPEG